MTQTKEIAQITECLQEKNRLFAQYEEVTDQLVKFDAEKAEDLVDERDKISELVKKVNREIKNICDNASNGQELRDAMYNKVNWSNCSEEYQNIFKLGQETTACVSRIQRKDKAIVEYAETAKESIKEALKKQNAGGMAKAAKYHRSTNPMGDQKFKKLDSKL